MPVAPLIMTTSPGWSLALLSKDPQVASPGFPSAAATASSRFAGRGMVMDGETTV